jgi:hypothetical protein
MTSEFWTGQLTHLFQRVPVDLVLLIQKAFIICCIDNKLFVSLHCISFSLMDNTTMVFSCSKPVPDSVISLLRSEDLLSSIMFIDLIDSRLSKRLFWCNHRNISLFKLNNQQNQTGHLDNLLKSY